MRPTFDERDKVLLAGRIKSREKIKGVRLGDFVVFPDGHRERVSHHWGDAVQTSPGGSFYLDRGGAVSFSGGLNPSIPLAKIQLTPEVAEGAFWFFHHDFWWADNGVDVVAPCRVFRVIE